VDKQIAQIKSVLEKLYQKYNHRHLIKPDPLQFVYNYSNPADMEIAGLLAAVIAYGRVQQIEKDLTELFNRMNKCPYDFVTNFKKADRKKLDGFKHRFTRGDDISDLLELLRDIIKEKGSIKNYFLSGYKKQDKNIIPALSNFCESLLEKYRRQHDGQVTKGLKYLLVCPANGSVCKRLNLFLRWMVRDDDVDCGLWKSIDKAKLIVPIDVHMGRLCKILGFYKQKTVSLSAAIEITKSFSEIEPDDPVKYDFALSRVGIVENCTGKMNKKCEFCELSEYCLKVKN
jgi:uncharacterized protein (TIGR02757 family)